MLLEVFKKDIAEAETLDCEKCVIAKALCRLPFPSGAITVLVGSDNFDYCAAPNEVGDRQVIRNVKLPEAVQRYILKFDRGEKVVPTVFNIPCL